ncbi:hypothetical protein [Agrobacterium sp. NPDC090283]|uniref:hypothetical protein n=1 Tax=Agrobacterium sp. NPDC090283 TaxID=3363920 RepID=UPI00383A5F31
MIDSHTRKRRLVLFFGMLLGIPFFATIGIAAVVISSTMGTTIWNSWSAHSDRLTQEEARGARIEKEAREQTFQTLCPDYFEVSFFDRWLRYRDRRWCESYRHKIARQS